jgi:quinol-cytochrome oxidoreductase complex cytochrome b subunit
MNLTQKAKEFFKDNLTQEDAFPTELPVYVNSVAYLFGASAFSALGMLIATGVVMCIFGAGWYHVSWLGRFINSIHFWSVQVFFCALIVHMVTKYFMMPWRDGARWKTWMIGVLIFGSAVFEGLLGFLSQTNWDSQWIALQSKDAMNAMGVGAFFNTMDTGQVLTLHVVVLPVIIAGLVGIHLFLVRTHSPVRPVPVRGRAK